MGCGCRCVGNGLALRRAVLDQLLADGLHAGVGELVERQHDEHARVEHHRHHAEQNFDGGQHLDRLHAYGTYNVRRWSREIPREVDSLQGASLMLRRAALDETGLLDTGYFMYTEEIDLCYRLRQKGWSLYWVPRSRIVHFGGQSTRQAALKMFLCLYGSKVQFFRKHYGDASARAYKRALKFTALLRVALANLGAVLRPGRSEHYRQLLTNYRALIAELPAM